MTRWLEAAQRASEAGTKPTKLTEPSPEGVLSEKSVLSRGGNAFAPEMTPAELARDAFEERAAIRQFDGGQSRAGAERAAWAEARRVAGITVLDDWRAAADDPRNPDNWL